MLMTYGANADDCTVLRVSDAYGINVSSRIRPELHSEWSHVVRSTRIKEPAGGILRRKQNFCFGRVFHVEDVRIILRSDSDCATRSRRGRTTEVYFLGTAALVRKFSILRLQGTTFGLDVSRFLAVVARH
jgi:hypothetical protein